MRAHCTHPGYARSVPRIAKAQAVWPAPHARSVPAMAYGIREISNALRDGGRLGVGSTTLPHSPISTREAMELWIGGIGLPDTSIALAEALHLLLLPSLLLSSPNLIPTSMLLMLLMLLMM
eukprot:84815-Rhodomonas_salina.2